MQKIGKMDKQESSEAIQEIERSIPSNVNKLRLVLLDEYNIIIPNQCDEFLARCLRQKDGNFDKAVKLVLAYRDAISSVRQWDASLLPTSCRTIFDTGIAEPLKMLDDNNRHITILRIGLWDPGQISFEQAMAFIWMLTTYGHGTHTHFQRDGYVTIWDYTGVSMQHVWAVKLRKLLTLANWTRNGVGGRIKELHLLKPPKPIEIIIKAVMPFMSEKLKKRVFVHGSVEDLLKQVNGKYLPATLGGELDPKECIDNSLMEGFFNSDQRFKDMVDLGFPTK